jgi:hypothetical protein
MARAGAEREQGGRVDVVVLTVISAELEAARRALDIDDHGREKDSCAGPSGPCARGDR